MIEPLWSDNQIYELTIPVFEMRKEYEAAIATKDAQIAMLEWALATLAAERKAEVAELEAIKASLAAKAAQTERRTQKTDMLQDAGDGAYTV